MHLNKRHQRIPRVRRSPNPYLEAFRPYLTRIDPRFGIRITEANIFGRLLSTFLMLLAAVLEEGNKILWQAQSAVEPTA